MRCVAGAMVVGVLCAAADPPHATTPPSVLTVSASVDKTTLAVGEQLTLTIALSGQVDNVTIAEGGVPTVFAVAAQSRSQRIHIVQGQVERSVELVYVLVPRAAGMFQLGPFHVRRGGATHATDPITIKVIRNALPPPSKEPVERLVI